MAALFPAAGPIDVFLKFRDGTTGYLGTCETGPEVEVRPAYINIMSDIGGRSVPTQLLYDGEQHLITLNAVNRYDWSVYKKLSRATPGGLGLIGAAVGGGVAHVARVDGPLDRGSLVIGSTDVELVLRIQYGGTVNAPELPVGRRYWSAVLKAARESTVGTRLLSVTMLLEANSTYEATSTGSGSQGTPNGGRLFKLYTEKQDEVLAGLPAVS